MRISKTERLKAVIFDLDGVVLDSMPGHVAAWKEAFAEVGLDIPEAVFFRHEGNLEWDRLHRVLAPGRPELGPEDFDRLLARQRDIYNLRYSEKVTVYPAVEPLLNRLSESGLSLALVTSSSRRVLAPWLLRFLDARFDRVVTRDQVHRGKPSPEPYLAALTALQVDPRLAVAVENAPAGIESAQAAGLTCAALATTLPPDALRAADYVFPDHESLAAWLDGGYHGTATMTAE